MSGKKKLLMVLLILVLLASVAAGLLWNLENYVLVGMRFYPRQARQMDLREEEISVSHYEKLQEKLPDCEILWDVPFQDREIPHDVTEITVQTLAERDIGTLECFPDLETVHAEGCTDYDVLLKLQEARLDLRVDYTLELGTETFAGTARQILQYPGQIRDDPGTAGYQGYGYRCGHRGQRMAGSGKLLRHAGPAGYALYVLVTLKTAPRMENPG